MTIRRYPISPVLGGTTGAALTRPGALATWRAACARGRMGGRAANWVAFGNSFTERQGASQEQLGWLPVARDQVRAGLGITGGLGYIPALYGVSPPDSPWSLARDQYISGTVNLEANYGLGFRDVQLVAGGTVEWTIPGTSTDIWVLALADGSYSYQVDGGSVVTVPVTAAAGINITRVALGASGSHIVRVSAVGGSTVYVCGFDAYDGDETGGLHQYDASHTGITSGGYIATVGYPSAMKAIRKLPPDLITIELGANDFLNQATVGQTPAQVRANLRLILNDVRADGADPSVLVIQMYTPGNGAGTPHSWADYRAAWAAFAADAGGAYLDLGATMPSTASGSPYYSPTDGLHLTDLGHSVVAPQVSGLLLDRITSY